VLSATLDSNTYISALNFSGTPLLVLNLARAGFIRLDVSDTILEEFAGVLRDKFR
jgi:predicted nucleic acid-binding protein